MSLQKLRSGKWGIACLRSGGWRVANGAPARSPPRRLAAPWVKFTTTTTIRERNIRWHIHSRAGRPSNSDHRSERASFFYVSDVHFLARRGPCSLVFAKKKAHHSAPTQYSIKQEYTCLSHTCIGIKGLTDRDLFDGSRINLGLTW